MKERKFEGVFQGETTFLVSKGKGEMEKGKVLFGGTGGFFGQNKGRTDKNLRRGKG